MGGVNHRTASSNRFPQTTCEQRAQWILRYHQSGLTRRAVASEHDVGLSTLRAVAQKFGSHTTVKPLALPHFLLETTHLLTLYYSAKQELMKEDELPKKAQGEQRLCDQKAICLPNDITHHNHSFASGFATEAFGKS